MLPNLNEGGKMKSFILVLIFIFCSTVLFADGVQPAGSGTQSDPYQVSHVLNLLWMSTTDTAWDKHYIQTADIDASETSTWNNGTGFSPIGLSTDFTGSYDGQNYVIDGLFTRGHSYLGTFMSDYVLGLFGSLNNATIQNLGLVNLDIDGSMGLGGIAGMATNSTIINCYTTGYIVASADYVGGLVGGNTTSLIEGCYSEVNLSGGIYLGGLSGFNQGGSFEQSYSNSIITGDNHVGGLTGVLVDGIISNCYSVSDITASNCVGGITGIMASSSQMSTLTNSYFAGSITGNSPVGGLIGELGSVIDVTLSYWDTETSGQSTSAGGGIGKTTAEMKTQTTFYGWDFTNIWAMDGTTNSGYPYLLPSIPPQPVSAEFSADNTAPVIGYDVQFNDLSTGNLTSWEWDFDNDGTIDSYDQNPVYAYSQTGFYTVVLTVSDGATADTETKTDYIEVGQSIVPDANFRAVINASLGQSSGYNPSIADLNSLTGLLDAGDEDILSIEGAQYLTGLDRLYIDDNQISDLTPVAGLTNLERLCADSNQIIDISAVAGLTNLSQLKLDDNEIVDISPVAGLTNLYYLDLGENMISNISPLANLVTTRWIYLDNNQISDLSALAGLIGIKRLYLWNNLITDIYPLVQNTGLGDDDVLYLERYSLGNPLSVEALTDHIPILQSRGFDILQYPATPHDQTACYPDPARLSNAVVSGANLSWQGNYAAPNATFRVWQGTTADNLSHVGDGVWIGGNQYACDPPVALNNYTDYFWKVETVTTSGSLWSGLWLFSTTNAIGLIADFSADQTYTTTGTPIQFTDLSTGTPTSWEWDFDNDGTIDSYDQNPVWSYPASGTYTVSLTASDGTNTDTETKIDYITQYDSYFVPCYTGNGYQNMTIIINSAYLEDAALQAGDEIGIFDGTLCVGAGLFNGNFPLQLTASQDDPNTPTTDGFGDGNDISFKIWDVSTTTEYLLTLDSYIEGDGTFSPFGTAIVDIQAGGLIKQIPLLQGWNLISYNVESFIYDMQFLFQPLINNQHLIKVQDENGNILQELTSIGWYNSIGDMMYTEGYYTKVTNNVNLPTMYDSYIAMPLSIPLTAGWNIMGFPYAGNFDAMAVVQPLINSGELEKVQADNGDAVWNNGGTWQNDIGNMSDGKGYFILVNADCVLTIDVPDAIAGKQNENNPNTNRDTNHYQTSWNNNPYLAMNIYLLSLDGLQPQPEDEIAIFDGNICVASSQIGTDDIISLIASNDDPLTEYDIDGFTEGNQMMIKYWDSSEDMEYLPASVNFLAGNEEFVPLGTAIIELQFQPVGSNNNIIPASTTLSQNYPNPFNPTTTISYSIGEETSVNISIYNIRGQKVKTLVNENKKAGYFTIDWDGTDDQQQQIVSGVYFYKMITQEKTISRRMLLLK